MGPGRLLRRTKIKLSAAQGGGKAEVQLRFVRRRPGAPQFWVLVHNHNPAPAVPAETVLEAYRAYLAAIDLVEAGMLTDELADGLVRGLNSASPNPPQAQRLRKVIGSERVDYLRGIWPGDMPRRLRSYHHTPQSRRRRQP